MKTFTITFNFKRKTINGNVVYIDETGLFIIKKRLPYFGSKPQWDLYVQNHVYNFKYDRIYNFAFRSKKEIIEELTGLIDYLDLYIPCCYEFNDEQLELLNRTYRGDKDASN